MIIATLTILLGTIYPIIVEVLTNDRISVGGPYFNSTVIPIMVPGFLLMSIAPILSWQTNKIKNAKLYVIGFILISLLVLIQSYFSTFNTWGVLGLILGIWIIVASLISLISFYKIKYSFNLLQSINPYVAHIGVGIAIIGITCSSVFKYEYNFNLNEGDQIKIKNTNISLEKVEVSNEINYQALRANFLIEKDDKLVGNIKAGKNYYYVSKMITTEAGIFHEWYRDIYFIVGDQKDNNWFVKVYINPLVSFIWVGVFIMVCSGFIGVTKR